MGSPAFYAALRAFYRRGESPNQFRGNLSVISCYIPYTAKDNFKSLTPFQSSNPRLSLYPPSRWNTGGGGTTYRVL